MRPIPVSQFNMTFARYGKFAGMTVAGLLLIYGLISFTLEVTGASRPPEIPGAHVRRAFYDQEFFVARTLLLRPSADSIWEPMPGAKGLNVEWNSEGFRGAVPVHRTPPAGHTRIVVMGDGATLAANHLVEASWPGILQFLMDANHVDGDVLNFSVPACTVVQAAHRARKILDRYHPGILLIALGGLYESEEMLQGRSDAAWIEISSSVRGRARLFLQKFGVMRWLLGSPFDEAPKPASPEPRVNLKDYESALRELARQQAQLGGKTIFAIPAYSRAMQEHSPQLKQYESVAECVARETNCYFLKFENAWPNARAFEREPVFHSDNFLTAEAHARIADFVGLALKNNKLVTVPGEK